MNLQYRKWRILQPTISELADGSGYSIFNIDIAKDIDSATVVRSLWMPGKFLSKQIACDVAVANCRLFIDQL